MATIIHPPDPWGGPRFALDVFSSLIGAWDKYQALQERKETRELLNQQHALQMVQMVLGFPDEYLQANAERVNRLGEQAGLGRIVTETGQIVRPTSMQLQRQQLETLAGLQKRMQERLAQDPDLADLVAESLFGITPEEKLKYKYGEKKEQLEIRKREQEIQQKEEEHPLKMQQMKIGIEKGKAEIPLTEARILETIGRTRLLEAQRDVLISGGKKAGNVKTFNIKWTDPETGQIRQGVAIFNPNTGEWQVRALDVIEKVDEQGNVKQVPVTSPETQEKWQKIKQDAGKVWGRYVEKVLKGRDLDWTDEKEVKRFQDYLQASGFITKMEKIPKGKRTIYSIIIIDPSDPKQERPIHGFPSEAAQAMQTQKSLTQIFEDLYKVFRTGGQ
jgi:hypothetical protein